MASQSGVARCRRLVPWGIESNTCPLSANWRSGKRRKRNTSAAPLKASSFGVVQDRPLAARAASPVRAIARALSVQPSSISHILRSPEVAERVERARERQGPVDESARAQSCESLSRFRQKTTSGVHSHGGRYQDGTRGGGLPPDAVGTDSAPDTTGSTR